MVNIMILPGNYIRDILLRSPGCKVTVHGWVKTRRGGSKTKFIQLNDGSSRTDLQVVVEMDAVPEAADIIPQITTGACVSIEGEIVESMGGGQAIELRAYKLILHGSADPEKYPLPKGKTKISLD